MAKKLWERVQEDIEKNRQASEQIRINANNQFNENIRQNGEFDTNRHTTSMSNLMQSQKDISNERYNSFKKSNRLTLWDTVKRTANDLGRVTENMWLGATSGAKQSFNYTYKAGRNNLRPEEMQSTENVLNSSSLSNEEKDFFLNLQKNNNNKKANQSEEKALQIASQKSNLNEKESFVPIFQKNSVAPLIKQLETDKIDVEKINKVSKRSGFDESIEKDASKISENIESQSNGVTKKLAELAPSIGNMAVGGAVSAINPGAGAGYFALSSAGSYYDDAKQRGMTNEQAQNYAGIMGLMEGSTEAITVGNLSKAGKTVKTLIKGTGKEIAKEGIEEVGKSSIKTALKEYGIGITDNVMQEALIEPIQEVVASGVAGKDKANWENMGQRMLQSGIDGGLVAAITGGAEIGLQSCVGIVEKSKNGENITQEELKMAVKEVSKKIDVEKSIIDSVQQQVNKYKDYNTGKPLDSVSQQWLNRANDIINENNDLNLQQNTTQNQSNLTSQQINPENKMVQNGNIQQIRIDSENFAKQVDNVKNIKENNSLIVLSKTPTIYKELGLNDLPMTITKNHTIWSMTEKSQGNSHLHGLSSEIIKQIPEALTRPLNVIESGSRTDSIVAITELADDEGNLVVVPIRVNGKSNVNEIEIDSNVLTSIYGKDKNYDTWMQDNIKKGRLLYDIDEGVIKKYRDNPPRLQSSNDIIPDESPTTRLQLSEGINSNINNSIAQNNNSVKNTINNNYMQNNENNSIASDLENNQQTVYNSTESEGGIDEQFQQRRMLESNNRLSGIFEEKSQQETRQYTKSEYEQWEQSVKPIEKTNITAQQKEIADTIKRQYDKDIVFFDGTKSNNTYTAGASYTNKNRINIDINQIEEFGLNKLVYHESLESDILHNKNTSKDIIEPALQKIIQDSNFEKQKQEFWSNQDGNVPNDYLVAKEILCDRFAEMKSGESWDYQNVLSQETNMTIDYALENFHNQLYGKNIFEQNQLNKFEVNTQSLGYKQNIENNIPVGQKVQANINLKKFKKENNIKNDIITESKQGIPISESKQEEKVAQILAKTPEKVKESDRKWAIFKANILDKGIVFEELSHKTKNRDLQGKWDYTLSATARGQNAIGNARYEFDGETKTKKQISKSLEEIRTEVGDNVEDFSSYMYHQLNIDRMTLEERFGGDTGLNYERKDEVKNKPVFGNSVTADISRRVVGEFELKYPEFKEYAQDVYDFLNANQAELVKNGVISQESAEHMRDMYPHYVPIGRVNYIGNAISVPLDTRRTGINTPIKTAKGGNSDILPLFDTIANRTLQTYRASARNNFGVELKNTLNTIIGIDQVNVDNVIDTMGQTIEEQELLQKGKNGNSPTFTVFENGEKVTYEITKDMYDALKPVSDSSILGKTIKPLNKISNFRRGVLTEYNPLFSITNAVKDVQDVLINSQHATKTYSKFPEAYAQIVNKGYWYQEYVQNGGEQNSYFNANDSIFESDVKKSKTKSVLRIPLDAISSVNNVIELAPRLSEYIASREEGRSIETSMLDASRVTTNFKAGGDVIKFANRNGATFLNASVQGAMQAVRNVQEANIKGLKGWTVLVCKTAVAGLSAVVLNNFIWGDDDDYDELQDYVKDNYYCIAKYGDGKFIRIPKGRTLATIQKVVSSADKYITDGKEINTDNLTKDFWECLMFAKDNLAPNNPIENNVVSPMVQTANNTTWYGDDIVPSRLQDKPKAEQYDETTDSFSIWLGKKLNSSPYKINYLLDQYGGGISDVVLPLLTKQAENNPIEDKFTTDSTMKSKYPGDFFELTDELKVNANSSNATDEDKVKYQYISSIQSDLSDLYIQKREIQNSDISDKDKKAKLKEVQKQINELAKNGLDSLDDFKTTNNTAMIGDSQYYKVTNLKTNEKEWKELSDEEKQNNKNISLKTYADYKEKISLKTIQERKNKNIDKENGQLKSKDKIQVLLDSKYSNKEKASIYENYIKSNSKEDKLELYDIMKATGVDINECLRYELQEFKSDKEDDGTKQGKSVSGSKKEKVYKYVNNMNITRQQKLAILGTQYKLNRNEQKELYEYINKIPRQTQEEKLNIFSKYSSNFTIYKNNTMSYK